MITKILSKYKGFTNNWYPEVGTKTIYNSPDIEKYRKGCFDKEKALLSKYQKYIPKGWYGFSLGEPCPHDWYLIIEEFLEYLIDLQKHNEISNFEIHQIKTKYGSLRFYVSYACKDEELDEFIKLQIKELERHLYDEQLIY